MSNWAAETYELSVTPDHCSISLRYWPMQLRMQALALRSVTDERDGNTYKDALSYINHTAHYSRYLQDTFTHPPIRTWSVQRDRLRPALMNLQPFIGFRTQRMYQLPIRHIRAHQALRHNLHLAEQVIIQKHIATALRGGGGSDAEPTIRIPAAQNIHDEPRRRDAQSRRRAPRIANFGNPQPRGVINRRVARGFWGAKRIGIEWVYGVRSGVRRVVVRIVIIVLLRDGRPRPVGDPRCPAERPPT